MARIYKPRPFSSKLDRAHPLSKGLIFATLFDGAVPVDAVTGYASTPANAPQTSAVGEPGYGAGASFPASGTAHHVFSGYTSDVGWLGDLSVFVRGVCSNLAHYNEVLFKNPNNGLSANPIELRITAGSGVITVIRPNATGGANDETDAGVITAGVVQDWGTVCPGVNGLPQVNYANGVAFTGTTTAQAPYGGSNFPVWIGLRADGFGSFEGVLLCVYVWSRKLSSSEMLWLHREPYAIWRPKIDTPLFSVSAAVAGGAVFRKTLSAVGTRTGSRQVQGGM